MISLDTNVLVRYFAQDDDVQLRKVRKMLNRRDANFFICDVVFVETNWVLQSIYEWSCIDVADGFDRLTMIHNLSFEDESRLRVAIDALRDGADLADELIVGTSQANGAKSFATFDKGIIRRHKGFAAAP